MIIELTIIHKVLLLSNLFFASNNCWVSYCLWILEESSLKSTLKAQFSGKNGTRLEKERGIELKYINKKISGGTFEHFRIKGFKDWSEENEENEE